MDTVPDACDVCADGDDTIDTDADDVPDACDNCPDVSNNWISDRQLDDDGDGIGNACDSCFGDNNVDTDGDGVPDDCDICPIGPDDLDTDADEVPDDCDNCPDVFNNWIADRQLDDDMDGVGNACDQCPGDDDSLDTDGDGVPICLDICLLGNDFDDADGDILPDACDNCPYVSNYQLGDLNNDTDNDGVGDACDQCPNHPDTADADNDGIPDGCDTCPAGNDNADADGDGVPDACDQCPGVDDALGATDNDGDGYGACLDCDDSDANIHPGAHDVANNGVDEDCAWGDAFRLAQPTPGITGLVNTWTMTGANANQTLAVVGSLTPGSTPVPQCPGMVLPLANPVIVGTTFANGSGAGSVVQIVPPSVSGRSAGFVAVQLPSCRQSEVILTNFP
ncbi:MAG: thrombospondin type 3 repeat-containing protein [Myxococcales bacterium]|nr:thrombospondin type 3 repeat-containing protein [Myxococcales bacterium]